MSEKTNTRRHRARREAFFLESVRDILQTLSSEISEVKACIKELQASRNIQPMQSFAGMSDGTWDNWMWYPSECSSWGHGVDEQLTSTVTSPPVPIYTDVLSRETLLAYRPGPACVERDRSLPAAVSQPIGKSFGHHEYFERLQRTLDLACAEALLKELAKDEYMPLSLHFPETKTNEQESAACREALPMCNQQSSVCADDGALAEEWNLTEIHDWSRETLQLATQAVERELSRIEENPSRAPKGGAKRQCLEMRAEVIRQRWQSAKAHIPESLLDSLEQMLQEEVMYVDLS